jgi:hypothetical protein
MVGCLLIKHADFASFCTHITNQSPICAISDASPINSKERPLLMGCGPRYRRRNLRHTPYSGSPPISRVSQPPWTSIHQSPTSLIAHEVFLRCHFATRSVSGLHSVDVRKINGQGAVGAMRTGRGNRSTQRKPVGSRWPTTACGHGPVQ